MKPRSLDPRDKPTEIHPVKSKLLHFSYVICGFTNGERMTDSFNCANNLVYWAPTTMNLESSILLVYTYVNMGGYSNTNHPLFYFLCM